MIAYVLLAKIAQLQKLLHNFWMNLRHVCGFADVLLQIVERKFGEVNSVGNSTPMILAVAVKISMVAATPATAEKQNNAAVVSPLLVVCREE